MTVNINELNGELDESVKQRLDSLILFLLKASTVHSAQIQVEMQDSFVGLLQICCLRAVKGLPVKIQKRGPNFSGPRTRHVVNCRRPVTAFIVQTEIQNHPDVFSAIHSSRRLFMIEIQYLLPIYAHRN